VPLDPGTDESLLLAPLGDMAAIEGFLNLAVELIQIDLINPVLEFGVLGVQPLD